MAGLSIPNAAALCEVAAALYLKTPSAELLSDLNELFEGTENLGADPLSALVDEYHELFFNPAAERFHAPFESFQRDGRYWGEQAVAVDKLYRQSGFDPALLQSESHWQSQRMPDQIGFELAFFAALLRNAESQAEARDDLLATAWGFHQAHIAPWFNAYGVGLIAKGRTTLYRLLGRLTIEVSELQSGPAVARSLAEL